MKVKNSFIRSRQLAALIVIQSIILENGERQQIVPQLDQNLLCPRGLPVPRQGHAKEVAVYSDVVGEFFTASSFVEAGFCSKQVTLDSQVVVGHISSVKIKWFAYSEEQEIF